MSTKKRAVKNYSFMVNQIQLVVEADHFQSALKQIRNIFGKELEVQYQFSDFIL